MRKLILIFLLLALAASAKTYRVTLFQPAVVAGTELQAGEYKLTLSNDNKAIFSQGKDSVESTVKVEQSGVKYGATSVRLNTDNGKTKVQEIRLGGTNMRLVFN